jgi:cell wall-associated NlpC family hydrolase
MQKPNALAIIKHKLLFLCALFGALFAGSGFPSSPANASGRGADAVQSESARTLQSEAPTAQAMLTLGARYRFGGSSPRTGFDCSGLVTHVFEQAWGVVLPHNVQAQSRIGIPVKRSALQPGDLVFYNTRNRPYSHVGIYLGEGRFIHAPRPGKLVRVESLRSSYWSARFNGARRVTPPG